MCIINYYYYFPNQFTIIKKLNYRLNIKILQYYTVQDTQESIGIFIILLTYFMFTYFIILPTVETIILFPICIYQ